MIKILDGKTQTNQVFARSTTKTDLSQVVLDIINTVRERGDAALFEYAKKFDKAELETLSVSKQEI